MMWCAQYPSIMILSHEYGTEYGVQGSLYTFKAEQDRTGQNLINTSALFPSIICNNARRSYSGGGGSLGVTAHECSTF